MMSNGLKIALTVVCFGLSACASEQIPPATSATPPTLASALFAPVRPPAGAKPPATVAQTAPGMVDDVSLRAQLGAPDFVRKEDQSELWRYDGQNCALFAFLYRDTASLKLRRMETVPAGAGGEPDQACVTSLKARGRPTS